MRTHIIVLLLSLLFLTASESFAQWRFNPQAGFSASNLSTDPQGAEASARFGYQVGLMLRSPGAFHIQPGIFWQRSGTELRTEDEIDLGTLQDDINLDAVFISLSAGYNLLDNNVLRLRANGGIGGTIIVQVGENDLGLTDDNFNTILVGAPIGLGVDILNLVTLDVSYELGLTNAFDNFLGLDVEAVNNVFRCNVGLVF